MSMTLQTEPTVIHAPPCNVAELLGAVFDENPDTLLERWGFSHRPIRYPHCNQCGKRLNNKTKTGLCRQCHHGYALIMVACDYCGTLYQKTASVLVYDIGKLGYQHAFCSKRCFGRWASRQNGFGTRLYPFTCAVCGVAFMASMARTKYCPTHRKASGSKAQQRSSGIRHRKAGVPIACTRCGLIVEPTVGALANLARHGNLYCKPCSGIVRAAKRGVRAKHPCEDCHTLAGGRRCQPCHLKRLNASNTWSSKPRRRRAFERVSGSG